MFDASLRRGWFGVFPQEDRHLSHINTAVGGSAVTETPKAGLVAHASKSQSDEILALVLSSLEQDKAEEIVSIDLQGKSSMADHMVICSGRSSRQVAAISDKLVERLKTELGHACKVEGKGQGDWVLIDTGDVVVHVFRPEVRDFYQLEKMWMTPAAQA
jgi:ribosome-associated protein